MNTKEIIEEIAKRENMSPEIVENEMRYAIRQAMDSQTPEAKDLWKKLAPDGKEPSIDRFLEFCVELIKERSDGLL